MSNESNDIFGGFANGVLKAIKRLPLGYTLFTAFCVLASNSKTAAHDLPPRPDCTSPNIKNNPDIRSVVCLDTANEDVFQIYGNYNYVGEQGRSLHQFSGLDGQVCLEKTGQCVSVNFNSEGVTDANAVCTSKIYPGSTFPVIHSDTETTKANDILFIPMNYCGRNDVRRKSGLPYARRTTRYYSDGSVLDVNNTASDNRPPSTQIHAVLSTDGITEPGACLGYNCRELG